MTRGDFLDVGVYEDFVRDHDESSGVELGIRWHSHPPRPTVSPVGGYPPGGLIVEFTRGRDAQSVLVSSYRVEDTYRRAMLSRVRQKGGVYSTRMVSPAKTPSGKRRASRSDAESTRAMRAAISEATPTDFLFRSREVREAGLEARRQAENPTFKTTTAVKLGVLADAGRKVRRQIIFAIVPVEGS